MVLKGLGAVTRTPPPAVDQKRSPITENDLDHPPIRTPTVTRSTGLSPGA